MTCVGNVVFGSVIILWNEIINILGSEADYWSLIWCMCIIKAVFLHWEKVLVVVTHFFFVRKVHKYFFYSVLFIHLSPYN